jgi:glycolate dehydrogenase FAD-binding subunit
MTTLAPRDENELVEVVVAAIANAEPLDVAGGGSRQGLGRPTQADTIVSTTGLNGVTLYEPTELVLTAQAGTPIKTIVDLIEQQGQELAFEPIDHGPLYGLPRESGTIGGVFSVNASGPRRIKAGAARDHLLGFRAVNGRGEVFQSGGRVMKNVTGYDMSKLMAGSFGTLGVLAEVTFKVLPKAETQATLAVIGLDDATAIDIMTFASGLPQDVSGLAHLPLGTPGGVSGLPASASGLPITLLRLEGPEVSVRQRLIDLETAIAARLRAAAISGEIATLEAATTTALWQAIRDCAWFTGPVEQIWRISTAPTAGASVVSDLRRGSVPIARHFYDWAGGLIWLALAPAADAHAVAIREVVGRHGGHATLVRADDAVRAEVAVFQPQPAPLAALTERVKRGFDPELILNRGRMRDDF